MSNASSIGKFALLTRKTCPPRLDSLTVLTHEQACNDLTWIIKERPDPTAVMAIDFETRGDWVEAAHLPEGERESYPVGCALSDSRGSIYVPFVNRQQYKRLMHALWMYKVPLIAHNVFFDAGWPLRDFGLWLNWQACTYSMYKLLATEGWPGQRWGLKAAQVDLLGWTETNEAQLDWWLIENGHISNWSRTPKEGYYLVPISGCSFASPKKAEMWRAPSSILGHYACLDADACWLLYTEILEPATRRFDYLRTHLADDYMPFTRLLIEQRLKGLRIDKTKLTTYKTDLIKEIADAQTNLLTRPDIEPAIRLHNANHVKEVAATEPTKWKKAKPLGAEPGRLTKTGTPSRSWEQWDARRQRIAEAGPQLSLNWTKWRVRMDEAELLASEGKHFNLASGKQLAWLLYGPAPCLGFPVEIRTDSGEPATDEDALLGMGDLGRALLDLNTKQKLLQFVEATLGLLDPVDRIHPGFLVPGTLTGRLSGKTPNIQQVPKVGHFLECWVPDEGKVWVDCDHSAIEPVVMCELSKDPGLEAIYGPNAAPNDVYLYVGANLPAPVGPTIRACGYLPDTPTREAIGRAKRDAKGARQIAKAVKLACDYGAGPAKLQYTLKVQGISVTNAQADAMWAAFWKTFAGIRIWKAWLEERWTVNKGWILNGLGRPLGVFEGSKKDLVNRVCQSTGHDIHIKYILIVKELLDKEGIKWAPVIVDFHDEMVIEVAPEDAELAKEIMGKKAYAILNALLKGRIPIKGTADIVHNLAEAKVEGWK